MRSRASLGLALLSLMLGTASCEAKTFHHGGAQQADPGQATVGGPGGTTGSPELFDGNFPEPATTRCGDVQGDLPAITMLHSAWGVVAVPGATQDGRSVDAGSVLLRLSEGSLSKCGDRYVDSSGGSGGSGTTGGEAERINRSLELLLTPDELQLGTYNLQELTAPHFTALGEGATQDISAASIELLRVDDDCIVGVFRGLEASTGEPFMQGGFVAQTCQRQCVPAAGEGC